MGDHKNTGIEIYYDEAVRFFKSQSSPGRCPMCESVTWSLPLVDAQSPLSLSQSGLFTTDDTPVLELKLLCNSCGFFRSHRASFIRKWLDSNPQEQEPEGD